MEKADLIEMKRLGAEIFTVALDAVTPAIFERTRGKTVDSPHRWEKYWQAIELAAEVFGPERFGAHLICGMGETERELLEVCQRIKDMGAQPSIRLLPRARLLDGGLASRGSWPMAPGTTRALHHRLRGRSHRTHDI